MTRLENEIVLILYGHAKPLNAKQILQASPSMELRAIGELSIINAALYRLVEKGWAIETLWGDSLPTYQLIVEEVTNEDVLEPNHPMNARGEDHGTTEIQRAGTG